jgi:glycosyltransferase involved in cell wall biosynthesis
MPDLRVLHVAPYFREAWAYGGIPRVVAAQVDGLAARDVGVTVLTTDACAADQRLARKEAGGRFEPFRAADRSGAEVRVFPNLSNALAYRLQLFLPLGLGAFVRREAGRFDVAHLHGCHNLPGVIAARHLRRAGVPYVVQPNGTGLRIERRRLAKLLFDLVFGRRLLPGAAGFVAVSEAERGQLHTLGVEDVRIAIVPNPVDLAEVAEPPRPGRLRQRLGLADAPTVLYLGQLSPRKRVDLVIRAVASLGRQEVRLVVAGSDMGEGRRLRSLAQSLGMAGRTVFPGVLEGRDRLEALVDADVVVYPSRDEIFGLVPLEALLCGTPVVVSDDCGCGEVIGETGGGLVVEYGSAEAVRAAVAEILEDQKGWKPKVAEASTRVRRRFSAEAVSEQLVALYRGVMGESAVEGGSA